MWMLFDLAGVGRGFLVPGMQDSVNYMMPNFKQCGGLLARTAGHTHPDVMPGTEVIIEHIMEDGYAVRVRDQDWLAAGSDRGATVRETRTVWFSHKNLELI